MRNKKQRTRTKPGGKKRMRIIAGMLCFCLILTTCPELTGTLSVQAAPSQGEGDNDIVTVTEQSVSAGVGGGGTAVTAGCTGSCYCRTGT